MAQIDYNKTQNEIIIALGSKIVFFDSRGQIKNEIHLPDNLKELVPIDPEDEEKRQENQLQDLSPIIQHIKISPNDQFLVVTTSGLKSIILYRMQNLKNHNEIISIRSISRASSAISVSPDSTKALVCDKTGDCYLFDCLNKPNEPGKWILAHLSIVYDVTFSVDEKYIITCDRDEKIRTTCYPNCHEIESYCLGHEEYVGCVCILPKHPDLLISISGDKKLKLWNWKNGNELEDFKLPAAGIKMCIKFLTGNRYELAVLVYQRSESVYIYEMEIRNSRSWNIELKYSKKFTEEIITNICYVGSDALLVTIYKEKRLLVQCCDLNNKIGEEYCETLKNSANSSFYDIEFPEPEDFENWFKKKFNNLTNYFERKKRRLDEKLNKKQKDC